MKNLQSLKSALLSAFVLLSIYASAQAPKAFSYQSVIRDGSGELVANQQVGIQISILQGSASGTAVYTETHTPTTNANGLASLDIGEGTPSTGVFGSINWGNGPYFVETSTDPAGGTNYSISSVSQLLSVPYALYAEQAGDDGDWIDDGTDLNTDKNVGIGVENPNHALEVDGTILADSYKLTTFSAGGLNSGPVTLNGNNVWSDFPDLSISFSLTETTTVQAIYNIALNASNLIVTRLMIDGSEVSRQIMTTNNAYVSIGDQQFIELSPGTHEVKVMYRGGGNMSNNPSVFDFHDRKLQVTVFGN